MNRLDVREHFQTISQSYFQVICKPTCIFKTFIQLSWSEILTNLKDIFGKFNLLLFIWKRIIMYLSTITRHFALVIIDYLLYTLLHHTFDLIGSLKIKFYSMPYYFYYLKHFSLIAAGYTFPFSSVFVIIIVIIAVEKRCSLYNVAQLYCRFVYQV